MRLKFFISMFLSCFLVTAYGQKVDNDSLINNMKSLALRCFIYQFFESLDSSLFQPILVRR